jgi:hypothetical protein
MSSLIFNHITTPVSRAGGPNMMLPVLCIGIFFLVKAFTLPVGAAILIGGLILVMLFIGVRLYLMTLARIDFLDDRIEMLLAVYKREIRYDSIESVKVVRFGLTPLIWVEIKSKLSGGSIRFTVPGPETALGSLQDCTASLVREFTARGIRTIEL